MKNQYASSWVMTLLAGLMILPTATTVHAQVAAKAAITTNTVRPAAVVAPKAAITTNTVRPAAVVAPKTAITTNTVRKAAVVATSQSQAGTPRIIAAKAEIKLPTEKGMIFDFHGAQLNSVLNYLSQAAGVVVVRPAQPPSGAIDMVSKQPLNLEQAWTLLNSILYERGYTAILETKDNIRTIRVTELLNAPQKHIPVLEGNDVAQIPETDNMVTQIIPVNYANAAAITTNLTDLLPAYAIMTTNDASNAVLLTATQNDIRRMVNIIKALDTSIANKTVLKVLVLKNADATDMSNLIMSLYNNQNVQAGGGNTRGGRGGMGGMAGGPMGMLATMMGGRGGRGGQGQANSPALRAAQQVTAVPDTRTNAVVLSAPEELFPAIQNLIDQIDISTTEIMEVRVFGPLKFADATYMAQLINSIYQPQSSIATGGGFGNQGGRGGNMRTQFGGGRGGNASSTSMDSKKAQENLVMAVADIRTNSVIVNANKDMMGEIQPLIDQLDGDQSRTKSVHIIQVQNSDPQMMATILDNMFGQNAGRTQNNNNNLSNQGVFANSYKQTAINTPRTSGGGGTSRSNGSTPSSGFSMN